MDSGDTIGARKALLGPEDSEVWPSGHLDPRRAGESGHPGLREEGLEIESCVSEKGLGNLNASIQVLMDLEEE